MRLSEYIAYVLNLTPQKLQLRIVTDLMEIVMTIIAATPTSVAELLGLLSV